MPDNLTKLRDKLREMFQLDQADLDFGIYRIMNAKRDEIVRFFDDDLLPQVREVLEALGGEKRSALEAELKKAMKQAQALGAEPDTVPKVKELKVRLAEAVDLTALEDEVFSHLYSFFRRYYHKGDFISLRRYKEGVYAIPYEGEEVKLYWANHDQYYVKSSEYLRDYAFKLPSGRRVHFKLVEADIEKDDTKAARGRERRSMLAEDTPLVEEGGELVIRFAYRPDADARKQAELNKGAKERILKKSKMSAPWRDELMAPAPTSASPGRTLLEKHLSEYTARNTSDYFIHKDLDGFLRRELDFYIKNEIMRLDDIEDETAPRAEQYLATIKAVRRIAHKIIAFLAQIEDFQKRLWLKKKFVVETNYCVTLDRVPEGFYPKIASNKEQREEWARLFAIDEIEGCPKKKLTVNFLKANPFLVIDTRFFGQEFKDRLLACLDCIGEDVDGVLFRAENFQALSLVQKRYRRQVKSIYIDPPYNTSATKILYKNEYEHSSWLSLMDARLRKARLLLSDEGILCVTIDDYESHNLMHCVMQVLGPENHLATAAIRNNPQGRSTLNGFRVCHEYALFFGGGGKIDSVGRLPRSEELAARWDQVDEEGQAFLWENFRKTGADSQRADRPKQFYPLYWDGSQLRVPQMEWSSVHNEWQAVDEPSAAEEVIWPVDNARTQRVWKWGHDRVRENPTHVMVKDDNGGNVQAYCRNYLNTTGRLPNTWWDDAKYAAGSHGTNLLTSMFGSGRAFSFPKSVFAVEDSLRIARAEDGDIVIDFFGGSGTTAHAVINLNREDNGHRTYCLVEMGDYFDTVMLPRVLKAVYSKDWRDGQPVSREGVSQILKYIRLESYEDTLSNLDVRRTDTQGQALLEMPKEAREEYTLSYMLDVESRGSPSLLNVERFEDPFNYKLNIATGSVGETRPVNVDLVETFNWLLGLRVKTIDHIRGVRVVTGTAPDGNRVLILWRNVKETDNDALDAWFRKQGYNTKDQEYDIIYVNGDNNLENQRHDDQTWKVRLIEEDFKRLMFDVEDV